MKKLLAILYFIFLTGCAQKTITPILKNTTEYQQQLKQLTHWQLEGKIAVRQNSTSNSASIRWQQQEKVFNIYISGPLGTSATRLSGTPEQLSIENGDKHNTSTDDPQQLIKQHLGWSFPLKQLPQWILGYSANKNAQYNLDHTLASFEEQGWRVQYKSYQTIGQWLLPEKISLQTDEAQITIIIKNWRLH